MKSSRSRIVRMLAAAGAAIALVISISPGPARAEPAHRAYRNDPLVTRLGVKFLPNDGGNPINFQGQVAGSTQVAGISRAAIFNLHSKRIQVLSAFAGERTQATDINDR